MSDGNRKKMTLANFVSKGLGVQHLKELELVHKSVERMCPSVTDCLQELCLNFAQLDGLESFGFLSLLICWGTDEAVDNAG